MGERKRGTGDRWRTQHARARLALLFLAAGAPNCSSEVATEHAPLSRTHESITAQPEDGCVLSQRGGHDYWFCATRRSWPDAQQQCSSVGTDLVRIDDAGEDAFIRQETDGNVWLGGNSPAGDGTWHWIIGGDAFWTGSPGSPVGTSYVHWAPGKPNSPALERCASQAALGTWNSAPCVSLKSYVCESSDRTANFPKAPASKCRRADHNGHSYWFCQDASQFSQAQSSCKSVGMDLASIDDATENAFVKANVRADSFIGLSDALHEGHWKWSVDQRLAWCGRDTGRLADNSEYANWGPHEPKVTQCTPASHDGRNYWFCTDPASFTSASGACRSAGMWLAHPGDAQENGFLASHGSASPFSWLGAGRPNSTGSWSWLDDGSTLSLPGANQQGYQNWAFGSPTRAASADCMALQMGGSWTNRGCTEADSWICEEASTNSDSPDLNDCSLFSAQKGTWSATHCDASGGFVCESVDANVGAPLDSVAQYIRDDYRSGAPRVSSVTLRPGVTLAHPFATYADRLGLRECVDAVESNGASRGVGVLGFVTQTYDQTYLGVPVFTRGYSLRTDPNTQQTLGFEGRFEPGINTTTIATVPEATALLDAVAAAGQRLRDYVPTPPGRLVIFPAEQGPHPNWQLAWLFSLPPLKGEEGYTIAVSATTGTVLQRNGSFRTQCASADLSATPPSGPAALSVNSTQQSLYFDPNDALGMQLPGNPPNPYVLYSKGTSLNTADPLGQSPPIYLQCPGQTYPNVTALPSSSVDATPGNPDAALGAAMYMSAQRCLEFFAKAFEYQPGVPWVGYDGLGAAPISMQLHSGTSPNPIYYNEDDRQVHFYPNSPFVGASIEVFCHELGHGLWQALAGTTASNATDLETLTLNEGFGDVVGSAAEMLARDDDEAAGWCFRGDDVADQSCAHDLKDPEASREPGCLVVSSRTGGTVLYNECPRDYRGPDYCTLGKQCTATTDYTSDGSAAVNCCTEHRNATVLEHAFYLMAKGGNQTNSSSCPVTVQPLDVDLGTSVNKAADVLFRGLRTMLQGPLIGYEGIADASLTAARDLYGIDSNEARTVAETWFAVNVKEDDFFEADAPEVQPARESTDVYPWATFTWPNPKAEERWDIQISTGSFDTNVVYSGSLVTQFPRQNGKIVAEFNRALPFDTSTRYFWRVRPYAADASWPDCYSIHSFVGTTHPEDAKNLKVAGPFTTVGKVEPGSVEVTFDKARGASLHRVYVSARNPHCTVDSDVLVKEDNFNGPGDVTVDGLLPEEHYFVNVQPIGPLDFQGNESPGNCLEAEFDSAPLDPPVLLTPTAGAFFEYDQSNAANVPAFSWTKPGAPATTRLEFWPITEVNGGCADPLLLGAPSFVHDVSLAAKYTDVIFSVPNGTGYCWDAYTTASNGKSSPHSVAQPFYYYRQPIIHLSPAESEGTLEGRFNPGLVGGTNGEDTYGQEVTLTWDADPLARDYMVKVGHWPWRTARTTPDPANADEVSSLYLQESADTVFEGPVSEPTLTLPGKIAGKGRYCWEVWPRVRDPNAPGELLQPPPDAAIFSRRCYTMGPGEPEIVFDNVPDDGVYLETSPITGHIHFPWIPDGQYEIGGTASDDEAARAVTFGESCQYDDDPAWIFGDITDCTVQFSIEALEGKTWTLEAKTYNSDVIPPVEDENSLVYDRSKTVSTGTCGDEGGPCCNDGSCRRNDLGCDEHDKCSPCGDEGAICCGGNPGCNSRTDICEFPSQSSNFPKCEPCGVAGKACCDPDGDGTPNNTCGPRMVCEQDFTSQTLDRCVPCGGLDGPCCANGDVCVSGLACENRNGHTFMPDCGKVDACQGDACNCGQPIGTPTLAPVLTEYQSFCQPIDGCVDFDQSGDLCVPNCEISVANLEELIAEGGIRCVPNLAFLWGGAVNASDYLVYVREFPDGAVESRTVTDDFFSDLSVTAPPGGDPRLFTVVVRGENACGTDGTKGPAAVGMIAVRADCSQ